LRRIFSAPALFKSKPAALASTAGFVGSSTASSRNSTSVGSITVPYSCGFRCPRSLSAIFQMNATLFSNPAGVATMS